MSHWDHYLELADRQSVDQFVAGAPSTFLVKRPRAASGPSAPPANIPFKTTFARSQVDPYASEWLLMPVQKRAGNPYPERISIGRATNCDIVLRVPFVSKVQAHLIAQPDGAFALQDNNGANRTQLNFRPLGPLEPHPLQLGDTITFVSMDFLFIDAKKLHGLLQGELAAK